VAQAIDWLKNLMAAIHLAVELAVLNVLITVGIL